MPSSTITVRFEDELYNRIKNHEICTSDLIRDGVRMYLDILEQENEMGNSVLSEQEPVRSYEIQDVRQDNYTKYYEEKPKQSQALLYNKTTYKMDKLKKEIKELNDEVSSILENYKDIE